MAFGERDLGQFIIERPREFGFQSEADIDARGRSFGGLQDSQHVVRPDYQSVPAIQRKTDAALLAFVRHRHLRRAECGRFDIDQQLFDGRDQHMASVRFTSKDRCEQPHHCRPLDRPSFMKPGPIPSDAHARVTAKGRIPAVDRRRFAASVDGGGQFGQALALGFDRSSALGHRPGL